MENRTINEVKAHKGFYRDNFRRAIAALFALSVLMLVLVVLIFYIFITWPEPDFYATSSEGALVRLQHVPRGTQLIDPEDQKALVAQQQR